VRVMHALVLAKREAGPPSLYAPPSNSQYLVNLKGEMHQSDSSRVALKLFLKTTKERLWDMLDDPSTSWVAQLVSWWIMFLIALSVVTFVVESVPGIHRQQDAVFENLETFIMVNFVIEFVLRVASCPSLAAFATNFLNIIDLLAILPFFLELWLADGSPQGTAALRAVRLVRVFRVIKVSRYLVWLGVFFVTLRNSVAPLGMIVFVVTLAIVLLSTLAFFTERGETNGFDSIPEAFWWCVITMTTIGYGDVRPVTMVGRVVGIAAAVSGVIILAIPISVISTNFEIEFSNLTTSKAALERSKQTATDTHDAKNGCCSRKARAVAPESPGDVERGEVTRPHWSATFLQATLEAVKSNRRKLLSASKQIELQNRDSLIMECMELAKSLHQLDRSVYLRSLAERELF
jgi:hypothetical protein